MADYYVREEDGTSKYTLEDGSGSLLLESSVDEVDPSFISSATVVNAPALSAAGFTVGFISSVTAVNAPTLQALSLVVPFIASVTVVRAPTFPGPGFLPISEDFLGNPAEFENKFGQGYDDFGLELLRETHVAPAFIHSHTTVYTPVLQSGEISVPFIASVTVMNPPSLGITGSVTISVPGTYLWICPPGISTAYVECYGAGGGGGGGDNFTVGGGGGGGAGAYAARSAVPVTPGNSYTFTVGAGGTGAPAAHPTLQGGTGSDTTFTGDSGTQVIAKGGTGGLRAHTEPGGQASACTGDTGKKFSGGDGGQDSGNDGGGGGASGNPLAAGANGSPGPGGGGAGANGGGSGGSGGTASINNATAGSIPGGGGGGSGTDFGGKDGGGGQVVITVAQITLPFIGSITSVYTPELRPGETFPSFIASVTSVYTPTLYSPTLAAPFISSVTVVYTPSLQYTYVEPPFISSVTRVYQPTLRVAFVGAGVSQVAFEVLTAGSEPNAQVSQVTLEILVPWYDGLHIWERTGGT